MFEFSVKCGLICFSLCHSWFIYLSKTLSLIKYFFTHKCIYLFILNRYQEAFAVSDEFAHAHSHLNSIRGLNTKDDTQRCLDVGSNDDSDSDSDSDDHIDDDRSSSSNENSVE